jgi:hypothetical protein
MSMEYRTWTTIENLPFNEEGRWGPFITELEGAVPQMGPSVSWKTNGAMTVVLADDHEDRAAAVERATRVIVDALHATGLGELYPASTEVEPVGEPVAA